MAGHMARWLGPWSRHAIPALAGNAALFRQFRSERYISYATLQRRLQAFFLPPTVRYIERLQAVKLGHAVQHPLHTCGASAASLYGIAVA